MRPSLPRDLQPSSTWLFKDNVTYNSSHYWDHRWCPKKSPFLNQSVGGYPLKPGFSKLPDLREGIDLPQNNWKGFFSGNSVSEFEYLTLTELPSVLQPLPQGLWEICLIQSKRLSENRPLLFSMMEKFNCNNPNQSKSNSLGQTKVLGDPKRYWEVSWA